MQVQQQVGGCEQRRELSRALLLVALDLAACGQHVAREAAVEVGVRLAAARAHAERARVAVDERERRAGRHDGQHSALAAAGGSEEQRRDAQQREAQAVEHAHAAGHGHAQARALHVGAEAEDAVVQPREGVAHWQLECRLIQTIRILDRYDGGAEGGGAVRAARVHGLLALGRAAAGGGPAARQRHRRVRAQARRPGVPAAHDGARGHPGTGPAHRRFRLALSRACCGRHAGDDAGGGGEQDRAARGAPEPAGCHDRGRHVQGSTARGSIHTRDDRVANQAHIRICTHTHTGGPVLPVCVRAAFVDERPRPSQRTGSDGT